MLEILGFAKIMKKGGSLCLKMCLKKVIRRDIFTKRKNKK